MKRTTPGVTTALASAAAGTAGAAPGEATFSGTVKLDTTGSGSTFQLKDPLRGNQAVTVDGRPARARSRRRRTSTAPPRPSTRQSTAPRPR
jgi:hypothetical protein